MPGGQVWISRVLCRIVEAFSLEHCLWASDWPYLRAPAHVDYGVLLHVALTLFPDASDRHGVAEVTDEMMTVV